MAEQAYYLKNTDQLKAFVEQAVDARVLAVDTEFIRERSYFPVLCLMQLATPERAVIVDPIAIADLTPLRTLFEAPHLVKVFHAGDQDIEIIYHNLHVIPTPLFDTQVAAELLGMAQQSSLSKLVERFMDVRLTKSDSFSDWNSRPLTPSQINYALDDVRYLPQIYIRMRDRLEERGRLAWLEEDFAALANPERYVMQPEQAWRKVKHTASLEQAQLGVLAELAATRDRIAMKRDLPRKWIVTDELLVEIARRAPSTLDELFHLRGAENQLGQHWGREMLAAVERGLTLKPEHLPNRKRPFFRTASNAAASDLLRALLNQRARDNQITPSMLGNKDELVRLATGERENLKILSGWRYKIVGAELLELLEGKLTLRLTEHAIDVSRL